MNKSLVSTIAAATLVGSIGLVYAQSTQGTDTYSQPAATQSDQSTQAATTDSSSTPSSSSSMDTSTTNSSASPMNEDSSLAAQADRN